MLVYHRCRRPSLFPFFLLSLTYTFTHALMKFLSFFSPRYETSTCLSLAIYLHTHSLKDRHTKMRESSRDDWERMFFFHVVFVHSGIHEQRSYRLVRVGIVMLFEMRRKKKKNRRKKKKKGGPTAQWHSQIRCRFVIFNSLNNNITMMSSYYE